MRAVNAMSALLGGFFSSVSSFFRVNVVAVAPPAAALLKCRSQPQTLRYKGTWPMICVVLVGRGFGTPFVVHAGQPPK